MPVMVAVALRRCAVLAEVGDEGGDVGGAAGEVGGGGAQGEQAATPQEAAQLGDARGEGALFFDELERDFRAQDVFGFAFLDQAQVLQGLGELAAQAGDFGGCGWRYRRCDHIG